MKDLSPDNLRDLQELLLLNKQKLEEQLEIAEAATQIVTLDQTSVGRISRMDAMQQQSMAVSTRAKATSSLREVIKALQRLADEDYGVCEKCDENIRLRRLMVQPEANYCLKCQDESDRE